MGTGHMVLKMALNAPRVAKNNLYTVMLVRNTVLAYPHLIFVCKS
jgi:hypothetical protein